MPKMEKGIIPMKTILKRSVIALALIFVLTSVVPQAAFAAALSSSGSLSSGSLSTGGSDTSNTSGIDFSTASQGYITFNYSDGTSAKMKAGMSFNGGSWSYYTYTMGKVLTLELNGGSGSYTVALFKKVGGSYVTVTSAKFTAVISSSTPTGSAATNVTNAAAAQYPQYLTSVTEISFSSNDSVSKKAAALCKGLNTDQAKIRAIYNYIAKNFKYDYDFANKVISRQITSYTPNPSNILSNKKGVCYDFSSLFAAMCRSQGIPCKLVKGYSTKINGYHAWNSVYDSKTDRWYTIDLTLAVCKGNRTASRFSKCYMSDSYYTPRSSV